MIDAAEFKTAHWGILVVDLAGDLYTLPITGGEVELGEFGCIYFADFDQEGVNSLIESYLEPAMAKYVPEYRLETCAFVLSLSADFLESWISPVEFARISSASIEG